MIHNSCDVDWRVWCCWQHGVGYLITGDCSCLGPLLQESRELPSPQQAKNSISPLFVCTISSGIARFKGSKAYVSFWCYPVRVDSVFHSSSWIFSWTPMGSRDAVPCTDHPILGQAVIVLHLNYPNCYESQDAFSSGHVECTSLPDRLDVFLWSYPS